MTQHKMAKCKNENAPHDHITNIYTEKVVNNHSVAGGEDVELAVFPFRLHDPNTFDLEVVECFDFSAASSRSNCSMRWFALVNSSLNFPFSSWYDSSVISEGLTRSSFKKAIWIDLFLI